MVVADVSTIILALVICFAIIAIITARNNKRRTKKMGKTLPGPPQLPLLGTTFFLTHKVEDLLDIHTSFFDSFPSIYQMQVGPSMIVNINDPDLAKSVLVDHKLIERAYVQMLFKEFFGTGLITARSAIWRPHRKIIRPCFNSTFLRNFIDVFDNQSKVMAKRMEVLQDGPEFELEHYLSACVFDIINETAMNVKSDTQTNQDQEFKRAVDSITEISTKRFFKPWLHPVLFFNLSSLGARFAGSVKAARGFAKRIIHKRMEEITIERLHPIVADREEPEDTPLIQRKTLLALMMDSDNGQVKLQYDEIIDELITVLVSATETTATVTNMVMLALACYPDVQKKVYEEVTEVCGIGEDDEQTITANQLNNLVYLEQVIKETLRLFPVVGILPRDVLEDMTIGDYHVPKGAVIKIAVYALHKNKKFWPDPLKFDPDRFLPEEVSKRHPYAYMPFGEGPRNCIGSKYAMIVMKIICARVVQKYALDKDHPMNIAHTKMKIGITLKPCDPVTIRLRQRRVNIAKV